MELSGTRTIPAPRQATWDALDDPATLKACIAGCESLERTEDGALAAVVAMRIGPVSARFKGRLARSDVDAPHGCTMAFDGQGGVAGFGKGTATVRLESLDGDRATALAFDAKATVGGKLAQIGSRLVDAAASKVADDFFAAFERVMRERHAAAAEAAPAEVPAPATEAVADASAPQVDPYLAPSRARAPRAVRQPGEMADWALAALVVVATVFFVTR
jgi:carbon monoxide dehydrogenase subunit G